MEDTKNIALFLISGLKCLCGTTAPTSHAATMSVGARIDAELAACFARVPYTVRRRLSLPPHFSRCPKKYASRVALPLTAPAGPIPPPQNQARTRQDVHNALLNAVHMEVKMLPALRECQETTLPH